MLTRLSISNYALIDKAEVEFGPGMTVLTGETGAGKSLIVNAISTLVGERISNDVIGQSGSVTVVEGEFDVSAAPDVKALVAQQDFDVTDNLILRREITPKRSRGFINDQVATLAQLKLLTERLIDLHGQHEHQSLLRPNVHMEYLDAYAEHHRLLDNTRNAHHQYMALSNERNSLEKKLEESKEEEELRRHELEMIEKVEPNQDEEELLQQEAHRLTHAEEYFRHTHQILESLHNADHAILSQMDVLQKELEALRSLDTQWEAIKRDVLTAHQTLKEAARFAQDYHHRIEVSPERLEQIHERLQDLAKLKRRFGGSIESVLNHARNLKSELQQSLDGEDRLLELKPQLEKALKDLITAAEKLSQSRKKSTAPLVNAVKRLLSQVGIPNARFEVSWNNTKELPSEVPGAKGFDTMEFLLSTNPGEPPKSLVQVASGGEISRIMLALKAALADSGGTYTLLFDEIDIGISGRVARQVGAVLRQLAEHRQVIVITHLPQIASLAHYHCKISKHQKEGRTLTKISPLDPEARVEEIASLMAGAKVTERVRASAQEMLSNPN
jgi:DNA repair protein RecN (Recombination protein N)